MGPTQGEKHENSHYVTWMDGRQMRLLSCGMYVIYGLFIVLSADPLSHQAIMISDLGQ